MLLDKKAIRIHVPPCPFKDPLTLKVSHQYSKPNFSTHIYTVLNKYKSYIDQINDHKQWDYAKKLANHFEMIHHTFNSSGSKKTPLSRSYYKMFEIMNDFNLVPKTMSSCNYAAVAEGPGGFIEAFLDYRKSQFLGKMDKLICMTLKSNSYDVPNWGKAYNMFKKNNIKVSYGADKTGNLYYPNNIRYLRKEFGGSTADLVTADGGFDYTTNFNQQEQVSSKLIFSEIVCALALNKKGGHFVLKIFDIYTSLTVKILFILNHFYEEMYIVKPNTSRPANSEKYVVCKHFRGIEQKVFENIIGILYAWNKIDYRKKGYVVDIEGLPFRASYGISLQKYNAYLAKIQIEHILKTLAILQNRPNQEDIRWIRSKQYVYAIAWCKKYNLQYNQKLLTCPDDTVKHSSVGL